MPAMIVACRCVRVGGNRFSRAATEIRIEGCGLKAELRETILAEPPIRKLDASRKHAGPIGHHELPRLDLRHGVCRDVDEEAVVGT